MRNLKIVIIGLLLVTPGLAIADASDVPGSSTWYLHVDFKQMKSDEAGQGIYAWLTEEVFDEIKEEAGIDFSKEVDRLTAYAPQSAGAVILLEGNITQDSKDKIMTLVALEGDLKPLKSSGRSYYRFSENGKKRSDDDNDNDSNSRSKDRDNIDIDFDSFDEEAWVSFDIKNKIIVTASEEQMQGMLARKGKIAGAGNHGNALVVLTAEKTLLQAGMNSRAMNDDGNDGDSGWQSNILRNTEQVAFLVGSAANMLAVEAKLITTEPEMAESLASVVRGLISLTAFSDDMNSQAVAVLQGTKVKTSGNSLSISLAIDPDLVVATLSE